MSEFGNPVNTTLLNSLLVNWILLISFVVNHFNCINASSSNSSELFRRHLLVYRPSTEYSSEMDLQHFKENDRPLSIVEPVYVASYGKSTSPFYLTDQQHLIALHQPDHRIIYLANLSNSSSFHHSSPAYNSFLARDSPVRQSSWPASSQSSTETESLNGPVQLSEGRSFLKVLTDNLSQRISKSFSSIKSVYNVTSRRLDSSEQSRARKPDDARGTQDKATLHRIAGRLGRLMRPKGAATVSDVDSNSKSSVNILGPASNGPLAERSSEEHSVPRQAGDKLRPFKETYKALFKLSPLRLGGGGVSAVDSELERLYSLASFVERNLRIIGLEPIYQLLSFNGTSFAEDENLRKLVKQIDSKLVQYGEFNSLFGHLSGSMQSAGEARSANRRSSDRAENNLSGEPTSQRRSSEEDLNEIDLLHELQEYARSKRSTTSSKQKIRKASRPNESDRHENGISPADEGGDRRIRREDNEQDRPAAEKRVGLAAKSKVRSRKRRSKKLGLKGKKNRKKSGRSSKRLKAKFKKVGRKASKKKKKSKGYNQSFPACDSSSESCKESEIHERYVPFANEEDERQASESYGGQRQAGESEQANGGEHNERQGRDGNDNDGNEWSRHQTDQQRDDHQRPYEPAAGNFRQDADFGPEEGRLKSSVKYERPNEPANYPPNYHQSNYEGHTYESGAQSYQQLDGYKQSGEDEEYGTDHSLKSGYNHLLDTGDGLGYSTGKSISPYLAPDYVYESTSSAWHAPASQPHDTKSLLKSLIDLKLKKKHPKSVPVYHHHLEHHPDHHLDHHHYPGDEDAHHYELDDHPPPPPPDVHHEKDELALVKELITNLLVENKHKILKILKLSKLSHLLVGKQLLAATLKILFGKGLVAKKHLIVVAYKKCYIKIKTVDLLLIPVGVGTLLTPLFLPLAPLALILFGIIKLFTGVLCFLLAI